MQTVLTEAECQLWGLVETRRKRDGITMCSLPALEVLTSTHHDLK